MALIFLALGIILIITSLFIREFKSISLSSIGLGQMSVGIFMLGYYYFEFKKQYLTIKSGQLIKNTLIPKKIDLDQVRSIREFSGDYTLKTDKGELVINTQIIEPKSLANLKTELKKLNVSWGGSHKK